MADDELKAFKIGDKQKPTVKAAAQKAPEKPDAGSQATQTQTFGFTRIETILDKEPPDQLRQRLQALHQQLGAYGDAASTAKERAAAKKSQAAIVRTAELIDYLFKTKAAMVAQTASAEGEGKKSGKSGAKKKRPAT